MDVDEVWAVTDAERNAVCELLESLTPAQWEQPSLCAGWRVREVAAHLALSHAGVIQVLPWLLRGGLRFNAMIDLSARAAAEAHSAEEDIARIRGFVGSRRHAPGTTRIEPMLDIMVHGQDIARPLGIGWPMPSVAAAVAASRAWDISFPFRARKRFAGRELIADDVDWRRGAGRPVHGPIADLLLALTGRPAGLEALSGLAD